MKNPILHELRLTRRALENLESHIDKLTEELRIHLALDEAEDEDEYGCAKEEGPNYSGLPQD